MQDPVRCVADWIGSTQGDVLLALDAPLGWPKSLATELANHRAREALPGDPDNLFHRATDRDVEEGLKKRPLEVGADRIARTAHSALRFLSQVRARTGQDIELAWRWDALERVSAIEVYPAATLLAYGLPATGYKGAADTRVRHQILASLLPHMDGIERYHRELLGDANALDAVVCVLAGIDFLEGRAVPPADRELALQEGWIWVRHNAYSSEEVRRR